MGFWGVAKEIGKDMLESAKKDAERRQTTYDNTLQDATRISDDRTLVNRFKNETNSSRKYAYADELKNRGYLAKDEDGKYHRTGKTLKD